MKRPNFSKARITFRRALRQTPDLAKVVQGFLNRSLADMRQKEYPVFVEPALRRFRNLFKLGSGSSKAAEALLTLDAMSSASSPVTVTGSMPEQESTPGPPGYQIRAGEAVVDSRLVEEMLARSNPPVVQPDEGKELGELDSNQRIAAAADSTKLNREPNEPPSNGADTPEIGSEVPVKTASEAAGSTVTGATQSRSANGPLFRTMVEVLPDGREHDGGLGDLLSEELQDVFNTTDYTNPRTKALLKSREHVNVHELAKELKEYARSIGAAPPAPRIVNDQDQYSADRL